MRELIHDMKPCSMTVLMLLRIILLPKGLTFSQTSPGFYLSAVYSFKDTVGKGEIARYEQFLLFSPCFFLTNLESFLPFLSNLKSSYATSFSLEESKSCRLGKS